MQNQTDSGTLHVLIHPKHGHFLLTTSQIKVPKCTKYEINVYNFLRFLVCSKYFKFSFHFVLTSKIKVIKSHNQNMAVLLNLITIKVYMTLHTYTP